MENLVTSKEVSEKLKKLGVKQESLFYWVADSFEDAARMKWREEPVSREFRFRNYQNEDKTLAAYTISELKEPLKPYMKDIEISARDDIFNPDFWGNYLISKLTK